MRLTIPLLAACAVALLGPAAAQAGTLSYEGDTLVYRASPGVRDSPSLSMTDDGRLSFFEDDLTLPAGCVRENPIYAAYCDMPARVRLELGDGDDSNGFSSDFPAIPVEIYGGDGTRRPRRRCSRRATPSSRSRCRRKPNGRSGG